MLGLRCVRCGYVKLSAGPKSAQRGRVGQQEGSAMKCPNHLRTDVAGYCCICGTFACEDCLNRHEGNLYCRKHYKPIAAEAEKARKSAETRKRHGRHHLIVYFLNGKKAYGYCHSLNIRDAGFYLETVDKSGSATGKTLKVRFAEIRSVHNVKSFDGNFEKDANVAEYTAGGSDVVVVFKGGTVVKGTTLKSFDTDQPRFYLIPEDSSQNDINILVQTSACEGIYDPEEYDGRSKDAAVEVKEQKKEGGGALSQEETMGDFYFETHNYTGALEQYNIAAKANSNSSRLNKKLVVTNINVGIQHIKKRDYPRALKWMDEALVIDPTNIHAQKKAKQLRKVIEKTERRMAEYAARPSTRTEPSVQ